MKKFTRITLASILVFIMMFSMTSCSVFNNGLNKKNDKSRTKIEDVDDEDEDDEEEETVSVDDVLKSIDKGDVTKTAELYKELAANKKKDAELKEELSKKLNNAIADYNDGKISYTDISALIATITEVNILDESEISAALDLYNILVDSKTAFESGKSFAESGDYYNAYKSFLAVSDKDSNYSTANEMAKQAMDNYIKSINTSVDESVLSKNYEDALNKLNEAINLLGQEPSLEAKKNVVVQEYVESVLADAEATARKDENFEDAILMLEEANKKVEDSRFTEAIAYYKSFKPEKLFAKDPYTINKTDYSFGSNIYGLYLNKTDMDKKGNTYDNGWVIRNGNEVPDEAIRIYYKLDGNYDVVKGVVTPGMNFTNRVGKQSKNSYALVTIYADDKEIYKQKFYCDSEPDAIELNITGADIISIRVDTHPYGEEYGLSSKYDDSEMILADFTIAKKIK